MNAPRRALGVVAGAGLGVAFLAACAAAAPPVDPSQRGVVPPGQAAPQDGLGGPPGDAGASPPAVADDAGPRCPYGSLEDPHRGFVRCLAPDERDAGWLPPPPQRDPAPADPTPPADRADAGAGGNASTEARPAPVVEIGAPVFENGQVTRVEKALSGIAGEIGRCVADNGGLGGSAGSIKVQFLVRVRGRAEGVEVVGAKGVSAAAQACVRLLLKNKAIGAPSADPVGVTVTLGLKPAR